MVHANYPQPTTTKPQPASNVSPLHQSGSTAMSIGKAEFVVDRSLYVLCENLRMLNPSVFDMVKALNVVLVQQGWAITTCEDLEFFIDLIESYEQETP